MGLCKEAITAKFTSGKFWLTIIAGLVFAYASVRGLLDKDAIGIIVTMVFVSYFQKSENGGAK